MTTQQIIAIMQLLADLYAQISAQNKTIAELQAENVALKAQLEPDSPE